MRQNRSVRLLVLSVLVTAVVSAQTQAPPSTPPGDPATQNAAVWVCPMHPDVMSAVPGKCPRCNMELVPAPASAYVCPMHPDVMSPTPGKCPRCNMELVAGSPLSMPDFRLHVETTPPVLKAGQPTKFRFTVHHPLTGEQARDFATVHDKLFHLFIVSRDLTEFAHVHPEYHPDGSFTLVHTLPKPGHYTLYSDFLARGGGAQVVMTPLVTAGVDTDLLASQARLTPDPPWARTADGVKIELLNEPAQFLGGEEIDLVFRFKDAASDTPITDLQRYLGAWGHLLILSEDMTEYVHAHPREETQPDPNAGPTGGPEIIFDALLPRPGNYKAWLQFQRRDRLTTVSFTFAAPRP
jgi:Heavy metal binding domain